MIIVEGPDGAGKSTLVTKLSEALSLPVGERATTDRNKLYEVTRQDTYTALGQAVTGHTPANIWDRLFFSEMVYAPVVGRDCEFTDEEQVYVKRLLIAMGSPIILCLPPWSVVKGNVEGTEQMDGVEENLKHIYASYQKVTSGMPWVMWYDYTDETKDEGYVTEDAILEGVKHYLENHKKARSW